MNVREIRIDEFDYPLPESRIALHPLQQRDSCKLLVANAAGRVTHSVFSRLPLFLSPDTLIVANETKVIRARLEFIKDTGARIEIFLLEPLKPHDYVTNFASLHECEWSCLIGNRKRWKERNLQKRLEITDSDGRVDTVVLNAEMAGENAVRFSWGTEIKTPAAKKPEKNTRFFSFAEIIEAAGNIPIPPYLKRESEESDNEDYQTVYSRTEGSVAAPTAGLHFTSELIGELKRHGDEFIAVTLHVGAGTFQPVKSESIGDHPMHSEWISVSRHALSRLIEALENGKDILAVGTTSVRTLESLPYLGRKIEEGSGELKVDQWMPYDGNYREIDTVRSLRSILNYLRKHNLEALEATTSIMIAPGFRWRIVNRLITNFHQPKSTLLLLVSSFLGGNKADWRRIYEEALDKDYRFLSYGDACLFSRGAQNVLLPLSKSMVLRAATLMAIKWPDKLDALKKAGMCEDSESYIEAVKKTLESVSLPEGESGEIHIGEGAAPLRFLTAFAASMPGAKVRIFASAGLEKRPFFPLVNTLRGMGADIRLRDEEEKSVSSSLPFVEISGKSLRGGSVEIDSSATSQFVSALLLASPLWENPLTWVPLSGNAPVSRPYIRMTEKMMDVLRRPDATAESVVKMIEPDWSAAAFFYENCLIGGRDTTIDRLTVAAHSLQGDSVSCDIFERIGVSTEFRNDGSVVLRYDAQALDLIRHEGGLEFDFTDSPDIVPAIAVALCFRKVPFRFHGVAHLRVKECDRLNALQALLVRLGYGISVEKGERLVFNGDFAPMTEFPLEIDPYGDHRIAMAFYPLELQGMVVVADKSVVGKSFPDFYQQFK